MLLLCGRSAAYTFSVCTSTSSSSSSGFRAAGPRRSARRGLVAASAMADHPGATTPAPSSSDESLLASLGSPKFIAAPMVGQSDLAFRLLVKRHGTQLAFTQMLHAKSFLTVEK